MSRKKDIEAIALAHAKRRGITKTEACRELELFSARQLRMVREDIWNISNPWEQPRFQEIITDFNQRSVALFPAHLTVQ